MKILIVTSYFPSLDYYDSIESDPRTKFLYYYIVKWVAAGHKVKVVHIPTYYSGIFNQLFRLSKFIPKKFNLNLFRFYQNIDAIRKTKYFYNGFEIFRYPVLKILPQKSLFLYKKKSLVKKITDDLFKSKFTPDFILSDFVEPNSSICELLKVQYLGVKVAQCFHSTDEKYMLKKKAFYIERFKSFDYFFFRSKSLQESLVPLLKLKQDKCIEMYSGIPDNVKLGKPRSKICNFLYVGAIRRSKGIISLVECFANSLYNTESTLTIIGSGPDFVELEKLISDLNLSKQVHLKGWLPRHEVFEAMRNSDCFVMVSKETFGMVYIEAMSQGNVVIAAEKQGIDGIIVNDYNGYLCPLNDKISLIALLKSLCSFESVKIEKISQNAINTSSSMYDSKLAEELLNKLN